MRTIFFAYVFLTIASFHALAQKIETQKPDRERIVHVQTALNHLTVIEVGEPVVTVAAGSSAFKIEWRENKVFIQPTEPNVATNLFIWTASGRLNYEPGKPQVFTLDVPTSTGLARVVNSQLTDEEVKRLKSTDQKALEIFDAQLRSPRVEPGKETVGVVGVKLPAAKSDGPTVLRLLFPADGNGPISATLVL